MRDRYPKLGPYTSSAGIYKCPSDKFTCWIGRRRCKRVRSVSMNGFIEGGLYDLSRSVSTPALGAAGWRKFDHLSHITNPRPSSLWVFADEHPDSINNGGFVLDPNMGLVWRNLPANYHNRACGYAFADGHAEVRKWLDPVPGDEPVLERSRLNFRNAGRGRNSAPDYWWVVERSSAQLR